ncbi:MAG: hypothetical protein ABMA14_24730 [Hyphomonadaceae bacterium]
MRIADLRASVRLDKRDAAHNASAPPKPPKRGKAIKRESEEDRAIKAEKQSLAQHTTSLLAGGKSSKNYKRPGERAERKSGGLFIQLLLVMVAVGIGACVLDPTIVPADWTAQAHELIARYVKL